ncbi:MAG: putative DNA binding domain-containing protein [Desulfobacteraceae bacterium]|nr:putative DNA binding domain-containing protein [Desulfobacteraceae bacterium]
MQALKEILLRGFESKDLDYKGPCQWDEKDKKACCEIVKDILAMANTIGGYIVIGVSEKGNGFEWEGLTTKQAKSFETSRINRFLQNYADPPINTFLKKVDDNGKTFAIIEVPRFSDTPHICQKDYPSVLIAPMLYVRTDTNESAPMKFSSDFRAIVEQAVRNRSDQMLSSMRAILTGSSNRTSEPDKEKFHEQFQRALERFDSFNAFPDKEYGGYREVSFHPLEYLEQRFSLNELNAAVKRAYANFQGWPFLYWSENKSEVSYTIQDGLETLVTIKDFAGYDRLNFWRLHQSGFFYHRDLMWEEGYARTREIPLSMDVGGMAMYVAEAIYCLGQIYLGLIPDDSEIAVRFRVLGTEGIALDKLDSNLFLLRESCICRVPEIIHERCLPLAEWRAGTVDLVVEICKEIFARFNWMKPDIETIREIIEKMFSRRFT